MILEHCSTSVNYAKIMIKRTRVSFWEIDADFEKLWVITLEILSGIPNIIRYVLCEIYGMHSFMYNFKSNT